MSKPRNPKCCPFCGAPDTSLGIRVPEPQYTVSAPATPCSPAPCLPMYSGERVGGSLEVTCIDCAECERVFWIERLDAERGG